MKLLIKLLTFSSMIQRCRGHLSPRIVSPLPLLIKQTLLEALPSTYSETFPMTFIIRKIHLSSFLQIFFFFFYYLLSGSVRNLYKSVLLVFNLHEYSPRDDVRTFNAPPSSSPLLDFKRAILYLFTGHTYGWNEYFWKGRVHGKSHDRSWMKMLKRASLVATDVQPSHGKTR